MDWVMVVAWERMVPRPMPGKTYMLLPEKSRLVRWFTIDWGNPFIGKGLRTLSWSQDFAIVLEVIKGATAGKETFSVGVLDGVFEGAFGLG